MIENDLSPAPVSAGSNPRRKVLFFDYWSNGIRNFVPLLQPLRDAGFDCALLHLGSWRDQSVPDEEVLQTLPCRDIRHYGGNLKRALLAEDPDVLLGLNFSEMMDRVVRRNCYAMGVPAVYMMHGVRATGGMLTQMAELTSQHWSPLRRLAKVPKYVGITGKYFASILGSRPADFFSPLPYQYMMQLLISPGRAIHTPSPSWDLAWDGALVYSNVYRDQFVEEFGFPADGVIVIGNPELDPAFRLWNSPDCERVCREYLLGAGVPPNQRYVFYVEEALVEQGLTGCTENARQREIAEVQDAANAAGLHLVVKMHPSADARATLETFQGKAGITILGRGDLAKLVWGASAVVAHFSTVCMMPAALGRPMFEPKWEEPFRSMPAGLFTPVSKAEASPAELQQDLISIANGAGFPRTAAADAFQKDFISRFDGQAINRIVKALSEFADFKRRGVSRRDALRAGRFA